MRPFWQMQTITQFIRKFIKFGQIWLAWRHSRICHNIKTLIIDDSILKLEWVPLVVRFFFTLPSRIAFSCCFLFDDNCIYVEKCWRTANILLYGRLWICGARSKKLSTQLALYRFEKKFHKEITLNDDYETRRAIFNVNSVRHFFNLLVIIWFDNWKIPFIACHFAKASSFVSTHERMFNTPEKIPFRADIHWQNMKC